MRIRTSEFPCTSKMGILQRQVNLVHPFLGSKFRICDFQDFVLAKMNKNQLRKWMNHQKLRKKSLKRKIRLNEQARERK